MLPETTFGQSERPKLTDSEQVTQLFKRRIEDHSHLTVISTFKDAPDLHAVYCVSSITRSIDITNENEAFEKWDFYDDLEKRYGCKHEFYSFSFPTRRGFVAAAKSGITLRSKDKSQAKNEICNTEFILKILDRLLIKGSLA